ncbi:hypothetical protein [Priestia megaterium]|uniref:hypothetical protein n=1 Tax=Priestia megaterium TaxID=1404 RepID=UPI00203DD2A3|nr:hypothetical protein [Priestia megaterium]MCM3196832.1 hypothetical protein [Priestia megaterium]
MKKMNDLSDMSLAFKPDHLEERIQESIKKIETRILKGNPLATIIQLYIQKFFYHMTDMEISVQGNGNPSMNKGIDIIQSLVVSSNKPFGTEYLPMADIGECMTDLDELFLSANMYVNTVSRDELIKYSQGMKMNVSGILYPAFEKEHFEDVLLPYNELFIEVFNITAADIVEGLLRISEHLRTTGFLDVMTKEGFSPDEDLSEELLFNVSEYFNVERITDWPLDFIKELALQPGECSNFFTNHLQVMLKELPIKYKPFLGIGNKYYCFSIDNLMDNFYRSVLRALRRRNKGLSATINNIQQDLSEAIPFKLFKKILPTAQMYQNIFYKAPVGGNGKNEWCECDGIIIFDNVMIILEVKGGALSPVSPFSDEEAYKNSLRALAQNPYEQSLRLFKEYKRFEKVEFYQKKSKKRYELIDLIEGVNFIQACCVTLDDFNEIASQIEKTEFIQKSNLPVWCVSMNDLRVYPELFDSPSIFLNYLYQRSQASNNPNIKVNDELDHIGLYFEYNNYDMYISDLIEEADTTDVFISSYRGDIDTYMARMVNKKFEDEHSNFFFDAIIGPSIKPEQKMDPMFKQLIMLLDNTKDLLCIRAARYLLLLSSEKRTRMKEFIITRTQRLLALKGRSTFLTPYVVYNHGNEDRIEELPVIMFFLLHSSNKLFKDIVERKRFLMERIPYEDEPTICILIGIDNNKKLKKTISHMIVPKQFQTMSESAYYLLKGAREKIIKSRKFGEL